MGLVKKGIITGIVFYGLQSFFVFIILQPKRDLDKLTEESSLEPQTSQAEPAIIAMARYLERKQNKRELNRSPANSHNLDDTSKSGSEAKIEIPFDAKFFDLIDSNHIRGELQSFSPEKIPALVLEADSLLMGMDTSQVEETFRLMDLKIWLEQVSGQASNPDVYLSLVKKFHGSEDPRASELGQRALQHYLSLQPKGAAREEVLQLFPIVNQ